jgi:protease I
MKERTMTSGVLQGIRVAILVSDGFAESELRESRRVLDHAGAATFVISDSKDRVKGWDQLKTEKQIPIDISLQSARPADFHALLLPGGTTNAATLTLNRPALHFLGEFMQAGKPVAAIGEALLPLLQSGFLRARRVASPPSMKSDLQNAGAQWEDAEVACDRNLITSRGYDDVPAFNREMIRVFAEVREHSHNMRKLA